MDAILIARLMLPAWLLCGLLVWTGAVTITLYDRRPKWTLHCLYVFISFSPTVLAGAYEIFWLGVTCTGLATALIATNDRFLFGTSASKTPRSRTHISILSLLAITGLIGVGIAIALRTPSLSSTAWISLATVCFVGASIVVSAHFLRRSPIRLRFRLLVAGFLTLAATTTAVFFDELYSSIVCENGWPPESGILFSVIDIEWISAMWFAIAACALLVLSCWLLPTLPLLKKFGRTFLFMAIAPLTIIAFILCLPKPPLPSIDEPNSMPQVAALALALEQSDFRAQFEAYGETENIPVEVRVDALAAIESELDELIELAKQPLWSDLGDGSWESMEIENTGSIRIAVRALSARGGEEIYYNDQVGAQESYSTILKLARGVERNGIWIHYLIAIAYRGIAVSSICAEREFFDSASRSALAYELVVEPDSIESVNQREMAWIEHSGWHSHVCMLLSQATTGDLSLSPAEFIEDAYLRDLTLRRLLAIELTIDNCVEFRGQAPEGLQQLTDLDATAFVDPYSPTGELFRYRVDGKTYQLYSVGPDGTDDGGEKFLIGFGRDDLGFDMNLENFMRDLP